MEPWMATDKELQRIVAVLHSAEALAKSYMEPVVINHRLKYKRESKDFMDRYSFKVIERIDPRGWR